MDTSSTPAAASPKPKRRVLRIVGKVLFALVLVLLLAGTVAHFTWKYSGDDQWKKVATRRGVTMYTMKSPGSSLEKFKAVWKVRGNLASFVMWASDTEDDSMSKVSGLYDLKVLEPGVKTSASAWKQPLASFLEPREFVVKAAFRQDPDTKAIVYTVKGAPDIIPPDDCCVRIRQMDNSWTLTPLENGEVQVEWYVHMDIGGAVPYVLQNRVQPDGMMKFATHVQKFINKEKYRDARYDWVVEPSRDPAVTIVANERIPALAE